jgi:hypothetical protein
MVLASIVIKYLLYCTAIHESGRADSIVPHVLQMTSSSSGGSSPLVVFDFDWLVAGTQLCET